MPFTIRNSLRFVSYKDRRAVVADLKAIYTATNCEQAKLALEAFALRWDAKYPLIAEAWEWGCPSLTDSWLKS